jgi:hypothetical protein
MDKLKTMLFGNWGAMNGNAIPYFASKGSEELHIKDPTQDNRYCDQDR